MEVNPIKLRHGDDVRYDSTNDDKLTSSERLIQVESDNNENDEPGHEQHPHEEIKQQEPQSPQELQDHDNDLPIKPEQAEQAEEADEYDPEVSHHDEYNPELTDEAAYDPENSLHDDENNESETTYAGEPFKDVQSKDDQVDKTVNDDKADKSIKTLPKIPGLPPRPNVPNKPTIDYSVNANTDPHQYQRIIKQACDEIIASESSQNPNFHNLTDFEKFEVISPQLESKGITLNTGTQFSQALDINFDQVYSYNKPYKNLKNPIPLIPINEFCKRPNITLPMTEQEDEAYDSFIKNETEYMRLQNWDELPDKSRLFLGNLPANTISKQDLFRIFSQYGEVIQIAIKAGYGFAQFKTMEGCLRCIKGETFVPLHNKIMRLDASKPQGSKKFNNNASSRGRERMENEDEGVKKRRRNIPECQIYTTGKSSVFFVRRVKRSIENAQVTSDIEDVTHREISEVISEAAYSGVLGTCVIKELKVDIQTFETSPDGGIKFDEYADIEPEDAADILQKAKIKKYGGSLPPYQPELYESQYGSNDNSAGGYDYKGGKGRGGRGRNGGRNDHQRSDYGRGNYGGKGRARGGYNNYDNYDNYNNYNYNQGGQQQQPQPPLGYDPSQQYGQSLPYGQQYQPQYGQQAPQGSYGYQQYDQYGNFLPQPPVQQQQQPPPGYNNYGSTNQQIPPPQPQHGQQYNQPNQGDLYQTLQNLDPAAKQSVLSILQQPQAQQGPQAQPQVASPQANYNNPSYGYRPINYGNSNDNSSSGYQSRSAKYSHRGGNSQRRSQYGNYQQGQGRGQGQGQGNQGNNYNQGQGNQGNNYNQGQSQRRGQNQSGQDSQVNSLLTQIQSQGGSQNASPSLMDTLAKLSKK